MTVYVLLDTVCITRQMLCIGGNLVYVRGKKCKYWKGGKCPFGSVMHMAGLGPIDQSPQEEESVKQVQMV